MEQAWKQSSVALGFQGVLISICSSETRGIKRLLEDQKKKHLCRRKSHFLISGFISLSYSSNTLTSVIFQTIQQVIPCYISWLDGQWKVSQACEPLSSHQIPSSYRWFIFFSLLLFCYSQRGKGSIYNTAALPFTASCCTAFWEKAWLRHQHSLYFESILGGRVPEAGDSLQSLVNTPWLYVIT